MKITAPLFTRLIHIGNGKTTPTSLFNNEWVGRLSITLMAVLFVTFFSCTTSPLFPTLDNYNDSPIFQTIGKYWTQGYIPYKDLWDLKGPFIFFVNAIGYGLTNTRSGVWLIQVICMIFTISGLIKIYRCEYSERKSLCMAMLTLMALAYMYEGGNLVEEYTLPLQVFAFYHVMKWERNYSETNDVNHKPLNSLLYGVLIGLCLMSRLTNALAISGAIMVISIVLLYHRQYMNFLHNAITFFAGFAIATLPFFIYFHYKGALTEMWNATFIYAIKYAGNASLNLDPKRLHYYFLCYSGGILLLCITLYRIIIYKRNDASSWLWLTSSIMPFIWFCRSNGFGHYGMTSFALLAIALVEMQRMQLNKLYLLIVILFSAGFVNVAARYSIFKYRNYVYKQDYRSIIKEYPMVNQESFVAYNCNANIYVEMNICPAVPFFALQDFTVSRNELMRNEMLNAFKQASPVWILMSSKENCNDLVIKNMLKENYQLLRTDNEQCLRLYKRRK